MAGLKATLKGCPTKHIDQIVYEFTRLGGKISTELKK
jgi:hypothetical protein